VIAAPLGRLGSDEIRQGGPTNEEEQKRCEKKLHRRSAGCAASATRAYKD
jgi:hypothetical protein